MPPTVTTSKEDTSSSVGLFSSSACLLRKPLAGVFVVAIDGISEHTQWGVANVGSRPTIGGSKPRVEAHVFDFEGDCYGRKVEITFLHKIRDEKKFSSVDELAEQIQLDSEEARHFLKQQ